MRQTEKAPISICFLALCACLAAASDKPISFSADKMSGAAGKKNEMTSLQGNAVVTVGSLRISGDLIELTGKDYRYVAATGNVRGIDDEKGYSFTAGELSYDRDTEVATFQDKAKLIDSKHSVEASAGRISYNQKTEIAFLQIDVNLTRKEIKCASGFALYRRTTSMLELSGSPYVVKDTDEFRADRITVNLDTDYITLDGTVSGMLKNTERKGKDKVTDEDSSGEADSTAKAESGENGDSTVKDESGESQAQSGTAPAADVPATADKNAKDKKQ
jgi:lipopolysaccharide export system protein LptA